MGIGANFMAYLTKVLHLELVEATIIFNLWLGFTNFATLFGAIISDAYIGRFKTIAYASFFSLLVRSSLSLSFLLQFFKQ